MPNQNQKNNLNLLRNVMNMEANRNQKSNNNYMGNQNQNP